MRALLGFLLASAVFAAVDGTVTNRTTGKPQAGVTVTLYKLGEGGLESVESVKSDSAGKFRIDQNLQGPRLLQSAYSGVTYNHMLPPGTPSTGVALDVYESSKQQGDAKVTEHMVVFEPGESELAITEGFLWANTGKTTFDDPQDGTLRFQAPPGATQIEVNVTAPQGMPIRRPATPTGEPGVYKVDFPIKPGQSTVRVNYKAPYKSPAAFESRIFYKNGGPTVFFVPPGVTIKGDGLKSEGVEPTTKATMFQTTAASYKIEIEGTGLLRRPQEGDQEEQKGPSITFVLPKLYQKMYWVLALAGSILLLGFVLLYRAGQPAASVKGSGSGK